MRVAASARRRFAWFWTAYTISSVGTWLAFDAFPLIAVLVLHCGPAAVSALAAAGLAVGAVLAVPLGPWIERRRKRPVMVAMDALRCAALLTVPLAYALGELSFTQLLVVSMVIEAADITFKAASGACLKTIVPREDLLSANARLEATSWTATALGPPLGGAAIGAFGPVTTIIADAVSFLGSALSLRAIGDDEPEPERAATARGTRARVSELLDGWRYILSTPALRPWFFNTVLVNSLILAVAPLLAVLMLGRLGFAPWEYGLAFGAPCVGGLIGSRLSRRLTGRLGRRPVLLGFGTLRVIWPVGLAFMGHGAAGLVLVIGLQFGLVGCIGVFNPVYATHRLEHTPSERVARTLAAWSITTNATIATLTLLWGALAAVVGLRAAIGAAGVLLIATPVLLPWRQGLGPHRHEAVAETAPVERASA